jgi:DHA2 family multidrug resistance protein
MAQTDHADISVNVTAINRAFEDTTVAQFLNPLADVGRAALDAKVTQQAQIIAYIDDYKLLLIATLALFPLLVIFRKESGADGQTPAVES